MGNDFIITPSKVKVYTQWQSNILVDPEAPAIRWKSRQKKDIYSRGNVKGLSRLGSVNSEDALSWNLFRTLEKYEALNRFTTQWGLPDNYQVLYWFRSADSDVPYEGIRECLDLIEPWGRGGRRQQTESDIILLGRKNLIMVENKLGAPRKKINAWGKQRGEVPREYLDFTLPLLKSHQYWSEMPRYYQLYRQLILGTELGKRFNLQPYLLAIYNDLNLAKNGLTHDKEFEEFKSTIAKPTSARCLSWQSLIKEIRSFNYPQLSELISKFSVNPCLHEA